MKIRFTQETYTNKTLAQENLGKAHWKEIDGNYDMLISLYQSGHTVHISDLEFTDTIILDLDKMNDNQANDIHDIFYIMDLTEKLGVEHIEVFDSASRKYNNQKLFINTKMDRNIVDNKDLAYTEFRTKFEELTGIACDSHMDSYTQITFGISLNDSKYYMTDDTFTNSIDSVQPKKIISDFSKLLLSNSNINNKMEKSLITFEKGQYIPLNQIEMNNKYGKEIRFSGRFDWNSKHYIGYRESEKTIVKNGSRHKSLGILIKCVIYNALNQNKQYETNYNENDMLTTVYGVIGKQFENSKQFLYEEGKSIRIQIKKELEKANKMNLDDYYTEISKDSKIKQMFKYTPRELSAKGLFMKHITFFRTCTNYEAIMDKIGVIAEGELNVMNQIKRYYKEFIGPLGDDGRKNNGNFADYESYILSCNTNDKGKIIVDNSHYHNANFRKYCKENNIKITKTK